MDPEEDIPFLVGFIKKAVLRKNPVYTTDTVLLYVMLWNSVELLELLLDEGLDIEYKNYNGASLLSMVSFNDKIELASFLLERGADPFSTDDRGKHAIDYAISTNSSCKLIKLLSDSIEVVNVKPAKKDKF
jgi:ankyrin repeat protein